MKGKRQFYFLSLTNYCDILCLEEYTTEDAAVSCYLSIMILKFYTNTQILNTLHFLCILLSILKLCLIPDD